MNTNMKMFYRTALSRRDFHEAGEFLKALAAEQNRTIRYALLTAAIVAYARPFSRNERDANAQAERSIRIDPNSILDFQQVALHTEVLRLRNKLVAHSEFAENPVQLLDSTPNGMTLKGPYVEANGQFSDLRDILLQLDVTVFQRIAELFAVHSLDEMYKLKGN